MQAYMAWDGPGEKGLAVGFFQKTLLPLLNGILPPTCLCCRAVVGEVGALCPDCWGKMAFQSPPWCRCCGLPFDLEAGDDALCGPCLADPPPWAQARSVLRYDDASKPLVLRLKHADRLDGAPAFGRWMSRVAAEMISSDCLLVPVPLHRWRLWARRYNQAALLANAMGRAAGCRCLPDALIRLRRTPSQGHLGRDARIRNVHGAFAVAPRHRGRIQGAHVVLIDDVMTTGATMAECARILLAAGADHVDVVTLARAVL